MVTSAHRLLPGGVGALAVRLACLLAACLAAAAPAAAQGGFFDRFPLFERRDNPNPFRVPYFDPGSRPAPQQRSAPVDYSRAPPPQPRKNEKADKPPENTIIVFGDSMADWLAYGLEEIYSETDASDFAVTRKNHLRSGLIRYDSKNEKEDWPKVVRDTLGTEKASVVVMMVGLNDRQSIREEPPKQDGDQSRIAAPERSRPAVHEFKSEKWVDLYSKRIDDTIAALKSRGVPVIWVGLPSIYGSKSTEELAFLDDLYRARADKAGITYVNVWDGFVNETGNYVVFGPDFEGQRRRLRAGDGIHFTASGALKLAHYVEREIRRVLANKLVPVALPAPSEPTEEEKRPAGPKARPLAGPVMPLAAAPVDTDKLLGGSGVRPPPSDPAASQVLVKGDVLSPPAGRADDFIWPRRDLAVGTPGETPPSPPPVAAVTPAKKEAQREPAPARAEIRRAAPSEDAARNPPPVARAAPPPNPGGFLFPWLFGSRPAPVGQASRDPRATVR